MERGWGMGKSLTHKIIESHYMSGSMVPGEELFLKVDQTLTHDYSAIARSRKGKNRNYLWVEYQVPAGFPGTAAVFACAGQS